MKVKYQIEPLKSLSERVEIVMKKQLSLMQRLVELESNQPEQSDFPMIRRLPDSLVYSIKKNATVKREW
jgi:hypothetical protein